MTARRGTSNTNSRGSAEARRARKRWLLSPDAGFGGDGVQVQCQFDGCQTMVTFDTMWVDRFPIPGCHGGSYARGNIRPSCGPCNMSHGSDLSRCPDAPVALLTVPTAGATVLAMDTNDGATPIWDWTLGIQRYARSGGATKRSWKWGAIVTCNTDSQRLPGHATKADATAAGHAWLRARGVDPTTTTT